MSRDAFARMAARAIAASSARVEGARDAHGPRPGPQAPEDEDARPWECGNGSPRCRRQPAAGFNPLGLCAECLTAYRGRLQALYPAARLLRPGEGEPATVRPPAPYPPPDCPRGCARAPERRCAAERTIQKNGWNYREPRPWLCAAPRR